GAGGAGLELVDDEQGPVAAAELLRPPQVGGGRKPHLAALDRLDEEGGDVVGAELRLESIEIAERDPAAARHEGAEALLEELVTDQRERPERDAVGARGAGQPPRAAG